MAGTYEVPAEGNPNSTEDPKIKAFIKGSNEKLNSSNLLEDTGLASPNNSAYRTILAGGQCTIGANKTGTKYFAQPNSELLTTANQSTLLFYFAKADYEVLNKTQKLRLRAQAVTTTTAPAATLTVGLYPVTAVSAGAFTVGSVTSGSTVAFATPTGNSLNQSNSGDFTIPSDGYYIFATAITGETAASSNTAFAFQLQTRSV